MFYHIKVGFKGVGVFLGIFLISAEKHTFISNLKNLQSTRIKIRKKLVYIPVHPSFPKKKGVI